MAETAEEPTEPIKPKICVLKASIHCEGCKRKVEKILSQLQGVDFVDVDTKQQKVTVTGSVDADTLIKKLAKSGKHAALWPNLRHKIPTDKEKENETQTKINHQERTPTCDIAAKETRQPSTKSQSATKNSQGSGSPPAKEPDGGTPIISNEETGGGGGAGGMAAGKAVSDASTKRNGGVQETKLEERKSEEGCSAAGELAQKADKREAVEKSNGDGGGGGGGGVIGTSGKKKKKGQSGNLPVSAPSSAAPPPPSRVLENQESGPPHPTNHSPPRYHQYAPPPHYYTPPPPPQPLYAVSYNTAYPTSSYTTSYYAAPLPYSHSFMHPSGPETEPPPFDADLNPRQPLDSFEMFSDENPNGCFIM